MATELKLPALGENIQTADVIKVLVKPGDVLQKDQPVLELETAKAVFEVPSSLSGVVKETKVKAGEKIRVGQVLLTVEEGGERSEPLEVKEEKKEEAPEIFASPSVRRLARERGMNLSQIHGSGPGGRILEEDLQTYDRPLSGGADLNPPPSLPDFSKWGDVERRPMSSVRSSTAENLSHAWSTIPHVTQFDKADITELEELRRRFAKRVEAAGGKLTLTAVILKVAASALKVFPQVNASIDSKSQEIIYKNYYHLGIAVDTDRGLLVPVIRDVDQKNILELAVELGQVTEKTRNKKLGLEEMQGASFTITNLGNIGGSHFTPIIHWPEVAILGVGRATMEPVFIHQKWEPRMMLPLSLSYDHRLVDGADGARFLRWLADAVQEPFLMDLEG